MQFIFDSHGADSQLNCRTGQRVRVIRALTEQEVDIEDVGKMFRIEFPNGYETDAFADELTLDTLDEPTCFATTQGAGNKTLYEIAWIDQDGILHRGGLKAAITTVGKWIEDVREGDPETIYVAIPADETAITLAEARKERA